MEGLNNEVKGANKWGGGVSPHIKNCIQWFFGSLFVCECDR